MSAILQAELEAAALAERRASRLVTIHGRLYDTLTGEQAEAVLEDAAERAAIEHECAGGLGVVGLVSVPTTPKTASAWRAAQRGRALRAALRASETDKHRTRLMRMRRSVGFTARAIGATAHERGMRHGYVAMVTLTYDAQHDWEAMHISRALDRCRLWHKEQGVPMRYVWVGELQTRGALHYHLAFWMPHGVVQPKWDDAGWWPHGMSRGETARDAVSYLLKYLSKGTDTSQLPKGARMHGAGGVDHCLRRARRWLGLPAWVQSRSDIHDDWRRAVGGGWADPDGTVIPSEHTRAWLGDRWGVMRVADYGRPFEAGGPFTWIERGSERHGGAF